MDIKSKKPIALVAIGMLGIAVLCFLVCEFAVSWGVMVVVKNSSDATARAVRLSFVGGEEYVADIAPHSQAKTRIMVQGESSLSIRYLDSQNKEQNRDLDLYLEPGYRGTVVVIINGNIVSVEDRTRLY